MIFVKRFSVILASVVVWLGVASLIIYQDPSALYYKIIPFYNRIPSFLLGFIYGVVGSIIVVLCYYKDWTSLWYKIALIAGFIILTVSHYWL